MIFLWIFNWHIAYEYKNLVLLLISKLLGENVNITYFPPIPENISFRLFPIMYVHRKNSTNYFLITSANIDENFSGRLRVLDLDGGQYLPTDFVDRDLEVDRELYDIFRQAAFCLPSRGQLVSKSPSNASLRSRDELVDRGRTSLGDRSRIHDSSLANGRDHPASTKLGHDSHPLLWTSRRRRLGHKHAAQDHRENG